MEECIYCEWDVETRDYIIGDGGRGIYIDGNGYLMPDDDLNMDEIEINFCPMCGRKLR